MLCSIDSSMTRHKFFHVFVIRLLYKRNGCFSSELATVGQEHTQPVSFPMNRLQEIVLQEIVRLLQAQPAMAGGYFY